jgi:hypothetical protein
MVAEAAPRGARATAWIAALVLLSWVAATVPGSVRAAPAPVVFDPFVVAVPVADQAPGTRRAAEREALERVLVRTAGSEAPLDDPAVRAALREPERFYAVSGFSRRPAGEVAEDPDRRPWLFRLEFDRAAVLGLLEAADARVWVGARPELLVWLALETEDGTRRLVGRDDPMGRALLERARRRGLPMSLPLLDLDELSTLSVRDVWGRFRAPLERAAARYPADAALTVRVYPDPLGRWLVDWEGEVAGERLEGAREVEGPEAAAVTVVDAVTDRLVERFAVAARADATEVLWLQVDGIDALDAYAGLLGYLEAVAGVAGVDLVQLRDASMLLRVDVAGAGERLLDRLRLEGRLRPADAASRSGGVPVWRARWRG